MNLPIFPNDLRASRSADRQTPGLLVPMRDAAGGRRVASMAPVYAEECRVSEWTIVCLEPGARPHLTLDGLQF